MLDDYLNKLQGIENENKIIQEGILTTLNKLFVLLGAGRPIDRRVQVHLKAHHRCTTQCHKTYPGERKTTRRKSTDYDKKRSDADIKQEKEETVEQIKENPKLGKCLLVCQANLLSNVIDVIKKNRKTICMKNLNKDLCEKWVERYIPEMEADLKALKEILKSMTNGNGSKLNININKLKKLM